MSGLKSRYKTKGVIFIEQYLTLRDFAKRRGISIHTAKMWRRKGLPVVKPAGVVRVDMEKADGWLKKRKVSEDAITYKAAGKLIGVRISKLRQMEKKNSSFKSVLIEGNRYSRISKTRFLEWTKSIGIK
jgi:Fe2+ transport system protein B